jgi:hypothetical protein
MNQGFNGGFQRPIADPTLFNPKMYRKWAGGGTLTNNSGSVVVSGLSFTPSIVTMMYYYSSQFWYVMGTTQYSQLNAVSAQQSSPGNVAVFAAISMVKGGFSITIPSTAQVEYWTAIQ